MGERRVPKRARAEVDGIVLEVRVLNGPSPHMRRIDLRLVVRYVEITGSIYPRSLIPDISGRISAPYVHAGG